MTRYSRLVVIVSLLVILATVFPIPSPNKASANPGWLSGWDYRIAIDITGASGAGTDYQVKLVIDADTGGAGDFDLAGHCTDFPNDVTFTDNDETTELDYWLESYTAGSPDSAVFWVEVADDLSSGTVTIYCYYGKSGLASISDGMATFSLFDFGGDSLITRYSGNPIIPATGATYHERDFSVFYDGSYYYMAGTYSPDQWVTIALNVYRSTLGDGSDWTYLYTITPPVGEKHGDPHLFKYDGTWYIVYDEVTAHTINIMTSSDISDSESWAQYGSNPILSPGVAESWDEYAIRGPWVIRYGDTWYLFYSGEDSTADRNRQIGLATTSAVNFPGGWAKYGSNPIFGADYLPWGVETACVIKRGDTFLFFTTEGQYGNQKTRVWKSSDLVSWTEIEGLVILDKTGSNYGYLDEFEWAPDTTDLSGSGAGITWAVTAAGSSHCQVSTDQQKFGMSSAELYRDGTNSPKIVCAKTALAEGESVEAWFRKGDTANLYFMHGNGSKRIIIKADAAEDIRYEDGSSHDTGANIAVDTWSLLGFENVNWAAGTYDIRLNGVVIKTGATMTSDSSYTNQVAIANTAGTSLVFVDDFAFYPLPAWEGGCASMVETFISDVYCTAEGNTQRIMYSGSADSQAVGSTGTGQGTIQDLDAIIAFDWDTWISQWADTVAQGWVAACSEGHELSLLGTATANGDWTSTHIRSDDVFTTNFALRCINQKTTGAGTGYASFLRVYEDDNNNSLQRAFFWDSGTSNNLLSERHVTAGTPGASTLDDTDLDGEYHDYELQFNRSTGEIEYFLDGVSQGSQTNSALTAGDLYIDLGGIMRASATPDTGNLRFGTVLVRKFNPAGEPAFDSVGSEEEPPCSPSIDLDISSWDVNSGNPVAENSNYSTGLDYFTITNNSGGAVTITIHGTDMTGGGYTWDLADDGSPEDMTYGLYAGLEGGSYNIIVRETETYNTLKAGLADEGTQSFGLKIYTPTDYDDGNEKSGTITLTVTCD